MKNKLLLVILNGPEYGGSEKHVVDIINNVDKNKYDVYLIMSTGNKMFNSIEKETLKGLYFINRNNPLCLFNIKKIIKEVKPDIIHAHAARAMFYCRAIHKNIKKKLKNIKLICTAHGWVLDYLKFNKLLQKMFLYKRELDDLTLTVSKYSMDELIEKGFNPNKLKYIYNGINIDIFNKDAIIKKEVKNISFIGRFTNQKGIKYLMPALKSFDNSKYNFNIYGSGELKDYIEEYIKEHNLKNVNLNSFIPAEKVREVLYNIDLLLLPSIDEGFPYILVEAMACGVPCIATDVGGVSEIIDEQVGKLINSRNVDEICEAINELHSKNISQISKNCIERSKKFSVSQMVKDIEDVYKEVLNG